MRKWVDEGNDSLWLFTEDEFIRLPDGIELESIGGRKFVKGANAFSIDTREGYMAYGVRNPLNHPEAELFSIFTLS